MMRFGCSGGGRWGKENLPRRYLMACKPLTDSAIGSLHRGWRGQQPESRASLPTLLGKVLRGSGSEGSRSEGRTLRCTGADVPTVPECAPEFRGQRLTAASCRQRGASRSDSRSLAAPAGARRLETTSGCGRRSSVLDGAGNGDLAACGPPSGAAILRSAVRGECDSALE